MRRWLLVGLCACGRIAFDASATGTRDAGDAGTDAPACGVASGLHDDFEDGVIDDRLWGSSYTNPGTSLTETGGSAVLAGASSMASIYVGLVSSRYFDMRGQRYLAEIGQLASAGAVSGIQVDYESQTYVSLTHTDGVFRAAYRLGAAFTVISMASYTPANRFWSIREEAGDVIFESSPDASTFEELGRMPSPFDMSVVFLSAFSGTANAVASPGEMHVESIGAPGATMLQCPATSLVESFDTFDPQRWANTQVPACCSYSTGTGQLVLTTDGSMGTVALRSSAGYDLRGSSVTVELVQQPSVSGVSASLIVRYDSTRYAEITVTTAQTNARYVDGTSIDPMLDTRDPTERWLRIREDQGTLYFEVSKDRTSWRQLRSGPPPWSVSDVILGVNLITTLSAAGPDTVRFDNVNTP